MGWVEVMGGGGHRPFVYLYILYTVHTSGSVLKIHIKKIQRASSMKASLLSNEAAIYIALIREIPSRKAPRLLCEIAPPPLPAVPLEGSAY